MAHELGKTLNEYLGWDGPVTHRQHLCWVCWLSQQWNKPSRADWYAMQIARMNCSKEGASTEDFKIKFNVEIPLASTLGTDVVGLGVEGNGDALFSQEPCMVNGKPFGPRRLTKADVVRLQAEQTRAQLERHAAVVRDKNKSGKVLVDKLRSK